MEKIKRFLFKCRYFPVPLAVSIACIIRLIKPIAPMGFLRVTAMIFYIIILFNCLIIMAVTYLHMSGVQKTEDRMKDKEDVVLTDNDVIIADCKKE